MANTSHPTPEPTGLTSAAFFDNLVRCEIRLYNGLDVHLRDRHGLTTAQLGLLRYVRDNPGCRVVDLAASFAVGVGAFSKAVDRSEKLGWIRREPNPEDRRSSLLALTPEGAQKVSEAEVSFTAQLGELLSPVLETGELERAAALLAKLLSSLEAGRVGIPTG